MYHLYNVVYSVRNVYMNIGPKMSGHWIHIEKELSKHATLLITKNYCLKSDQSFRKRRCCEMFFADGDGAPLG